MIPALITIGRSPQPTGPGRPAPPPRTPRPGGRASPSTPPERHGRAGRGSVGRMVAAAPAPSPPPPVARVVFGRSVQGRPLSFVRVGDRDAPVHVLVVGCVHGNECAGLRILRVLERRRSPRGTALWIVPPLTPDGGAVGSRGNAHTVDLNRNYPWRWAPTGPPGS